MGFTNFQNVVRADKAIQYPLDEIRDNDERLVKSWVSVQTKDSQGEVVPIAEMKKVFNTFMKRGGFVIDSHTNRVVGKVLNWGIEKHEKTKSDGIWADWLVYKDYSIDNEVWDEIKSGERKGLSFGGRAVGGSTVKRDKYSKSPANWLQDIEAYEISSVKEPANKFAVNTHVNFLAKSDNNLTEIELERINKIIEISKQDETNPWAVCTASVGQEDKAKFESCVQQVKEQLGMKSEETTKGPVCMQILQEKFGVSKEEAYDICYADEKHKEDISKEKNVDKTMYKIVNLAGGAGKVLEATFEDGSKQFVKLSKEAFFGKAGSAVFDTVLLDTVEAKIGKLPEGKEPEKAKPEDFVVDRYPLKSNNFVKEIKNILKISKNRFANKIKSILLNPKNGGDQYGKKR